MPDFKNLPGIFYADLKSASIKFHSDPPGTLNVPRMMEQRPCWANESDATATPPKKLLFTSWRARDWAENEIEEVIETLKAFINNGFEIYLKQDHTLEPLPLLSLEILWDEKVRMGMEPDYSDKLFTLAHEQHRLSRGETLIFDDHWLACSISNDFQQPRVLELSSERYENEEEDALSIFDLIAMLMTAEPPLARVSVTDFGYLGEQMVEAIQSAFTGLDVEISALPHHLILEKHRDNTVNREADAVFLNNQRFDGNSLARVHSMTVAEDLPPQQADCIQFLLEHCPNLKTFNCYTLHRSFDWRLIKARSLESLSLVLSHFDGIQDTLSTIKVLELRRPHETPLVCDLANLLEPFSNLSELHLIDFLYGQTLQSTKMLPNIKILHLENIVSLGTVKYLLPKLPNLEKIYLSSNDDWKGWKALNSKKLEELLTIIETHCPNALIKSLALSDENHLLNEETVLKLFDTKILSTLEVLDLGFNNDGVPHALLSRLPPTLETLSIRECENTTPSDPLLNVSKLTQQYPHLKKLQLCEIAIDDLDFFNMLEKIFPQVESIDLHDVDISDVTLETNNPAPANNTLPHLKRLNYYSGYNHPTLVPKLLIAAPNIKAIEVHGQFDFDELPTSEPVLKRLTGKLQTHSPVHIEATYEISGDEYEKLGPEETKNVNAAFIKLTTDTITAFCEKFSPPHPYHIALPDKNIKEPKTKEKFPYAPHKTASTSGISSGMPYNQQAQVESAKHTNPHKTVKEPFKFDPSPEHSASKNQDMVVNKLCQYLSLKKQHLSLIPRIRRGICAMLSEHFVDSWNGTGRNFDLFLQESQSWNGQLNTLSNDLRNDFDTLVKRVRSPIQQKKFFIGDQPLAEFLEVNLPPGTARFFINPWHQIAVGRALNGDFNVYEPNDIRGPLRMASSAAASYIIERLGELIVICQAVPPNYGPSAELNVNDFFKQGGLLALNCSSFQENCRQAIQTHCDSGILEEAAFESLIIRDTLGRPSWYFGILTSDVFFQSITATLLKRFFEFNPEHFEQKITKSLECLTPFQKTEAITHTIQKLTDSPVRERLIRILSQTPELLEHHERQLETWKQSEQADRSIVGFCQRCLRNPAKTQLITFHNKPQLLSARNTILDLPIPVFYIDRPDDLRCLERYIVANGLAGALREGPGGALFDFLQTSPNGTMLINLDSDALSPADRTSLHDLLDNRTLGSVALPEGMSLLFMHNEQNHAAQPDSSFFSRMAHVEKAPLKFGTQSIQYPSFPILKRNNRFPKNPPFQINLFNSDHWETQLLGRWHLHDNQLHFEPGLLQQALATGAPPIEILNGPWDDEDFIDFWEQLRHGGVRIPGFSEPMSLPPQVEIVRSEGYDWKHLKSRFLPKTDAFFAEASRPAHEILNPGTLTKFFERTEICDGVLFERPGVIAEHQGGLLKIQVTRGLSEHQWARLLMACDQYNVTLDVDRHYGNLPDVLEDVVLPSPKPSTFLWKEQTTQFFTTPDIECTTKIISEQNPDHVVIDVSGYTASDLLERIDAQWNEASGQYEFQSMAGPLKTHSRILLKGQFSNALYDALTDWMNPLNQKNTNFQFICIGDDQSPFTHSEEHYHHAVTLGEKYTYLLNTFSEVIESKTLEAMVQDHPEEPCARLQARGQYLLAHNDLSEAAIADTDNAWVGFERLPNDYANLQPFESQNSEEVAEQFQQNRLDEVNRLLQYTPYVFLSGITGVGKTHFVEHSLCGPASGNTLYRGADALKAWAHDQSPEGLKILFLDEANLPGNLDFNCFENLYQTPPRILIDGELVALDENHKIIFAGNPISYGHERHLSRIFQQHGGAVLFKPLPLELIYHDTLLPIFENSKIKPEMIEQLCQKILEVYQTICALSETEVLMTPRELQSIALTLMSQIETDPELATKVIIQSIIYDLTKNLVPEKFRAEFDKTYAPQGPIFESREGQGEHSGASNQALDTGFVVTPSRRETIDKLNFLLRLSQWRQLHQHDGNEQQLYGGLGGMILEGEPGIGKSEMLLRLLREQGFDECHDLEGPPPQNPSFFRMPANLSIAHKKELLILAFHQGIPVIIDEISSSPMFESLMNDLLMGKDPEGRRPERPGFMLIGTQNPATRSGRMEISPALRRRLFHERLPEYTHQEMVEILCAYQLHHKDAENIATAFFNQKMQAQRHNYKPEPTFRDVLKYAKQHLEGENRKIELLQQTLQNQQPEELQEAHQTASEPDVMEVDQRRRFFSSRRRTRDEMSDEISEEESEPDEAPDYKRPKT